MRYTRPRAITAEDEVAEFDSGEPTLDDWLRQRALANHVAGASTCVVTCDEERVVGYYALAASTVQRTAAPKAIRRSMPDPIPVILLGRLAVDSKHHGRRLGAFLLRDAIERTVAAAELVGVRALLVHTMNDTARAFYLHWDFVPTVTDEMHLLLSIKDARLLVNGGSI